jgi:hypothetical protein
MTEKLPYIQNLTWIPKIFVPRPADERVVELVKMGEAEIVAHMVLTDLKALPDSKKRQFVVEAAENHLNRLIDLEVDSKYIQSRRERVNLIRNGRKEGEALVEQLKSIYPFARRK